MKTLLPLLLALLASTHALATEAANISTIAFGSCAKQNKPQPVWQQVNAIAPELFIFLGDNIYADTHNPKVIDKKYRQLGEIPGFQTLRNNTQVLATWDDHDYGQNDAGRENPIKNESRQRMLDFWQVPENSPRRSQKGGIYGAHYFGDDAHRVQVLLLDLRWNRTPLISVSKKEYSERKKNNQGPYVKNMAQDAVFLGEDQWQWLEAELQKPAKIRILASSLQLLADFTGWEAWANFPGELERLYSLINRHQVEGLLVISGDTHWAELSKKTTGLPYPLYDLTSSGLTEEWHQISPNQYRISKAYAEANFGLITIDWQARPVSVSLSVINQHGKPLIAHRLSLDELSK